MAHAYRHTTYAFMHERWPLVTICSMYFVDGHFSNGFIVSSAYLSERYRRNYRDNILTARQHFAFLFMPINRRAIPSKIWKPRAFQMLIAHRLLMP